MRGPAKHLAPVLCAADRQGRFKAFLPGVATNCLGNRLQWFQLTRLYETASSSSCLGVAVNASCIRFEMSLDFSA